MRRPAVALGVFGTPARLAVWVAEIPGRPWLDDAADVTGGVKASGTPSAASEASGDEGFEHRPRHSVLCVVSQSVAPILQFPAYSLAFGKHRSSSASVGEKREKEIGRAHV